MAARPDNTLATSKVLIRRGYQFVEPASSRALWYGFMNRLLDPFARAVATMALITECHPFDDGNGRVARLTSNAELSAAGEVRILIPTVYRNSYLAGLSAFSNGAGHGESLIAVLEYAHRWTSTIDWSTYERANELLTMSNAYMDPGIAESTGRRLAFPI